MSEQMEYKELEVADLTKEELLRLIREKMWPLPTNKDLWYLKWHSKCEERQQVMALSIKESEKWTQDDSMEARVKWMDASQEFERGVAIGEEADKILEHIRSL